MTTLWRDAAIALLLCGTLAACASPAYSTNLDAPQAATPHSAPKPEYPIDTQTPGPDQQARAVAPPPSSDESAGAQLAAPVAPVETQALPPPAAAPASAPPAASTPPATSASVDTALTPQSLAHDKVVETAPPPEPAPTPHMATPTRQVAAPPERHGGMVATRLAITGEVVHGSGGVFENYEVRRGDHIDALARAFSTTRKVILGANDVRPPYLLHPGQILKVPVANAYVARGGDTLSGVAKRFSVNPGELAEINHLSAHAALRAGEEIGLPSSMRDRGPQRVSTGEAEYAEAAPPRESAPAYAPPTPRPTPPPAASYSAPPPSHADPVYSPSPVTPAPMHRVVQVAPAPAIPVQRSPGGSSGYIAQPSGPSTPQATPGYTDGEIAQAARGRFTWPVHGDILQRFGPQGVGRRNDGVDIKAAQGSVVKAAASGEVVYAGDQVPGFGNLVLLKHADGWVTAYAHLDSVNVAMKQQVSQGQALGSVGMSGGALQPELHFEVRYAPTPADKAKPVDPVLVLPMG